MKTAADSGPRVLHPSKRVQYLAVGQLIPWLFSVGKDLPQHHPETPDVTLCGELSVHDAFRRHPTNRQHGSSTNLREIMDNI